MKRKIVPTVFLVGMLLVSLTALAAEKKDGVDCTCSRAMVAGTWAYTETGMFNLNGVWIPYASVGRYTISLDGTLSGARTAIAGHVATPLKATIKGTATVNSDCTGTETLNFYDPDTGQLTGTAVKSLVYYDSGKGVRKILIPGSVQAVLTTEARKVFPDAFWSELP